MPIQMPEEPKKYTTVYSDFRGVDFTNDPSAVFKRRSPYALNMIPDAGGTPYKRTGWSVEYRGVEKEPIRNMWSFDFAEESHLLYVRGDKVLRLGDEETAIMTLSSETAEVTGVYFNSMSGGKFYLLADSKLMEYAEDDGAFELNEISPYIPTILIGRSPLGGGTVYEGVNLLTRARTESFLGDSSAREYFVSSVIDNTKDVFVLVKAGNGVYNILTKDVDYTVGTQSIVFTTVQPPVVVGEDNVRITYYASSSSLAGNALINCTIASVYENKIFLSGTKGEYKSRIWYSAYADPTYFPDLNYFVVGDDYGGVMGLIDLGEYLGVIKESNPESSTVFLAYSVTLDDDTAYAVKQSITGVGALSKKTFNSLGGEQLFLSDDGIYGIMADMQSSEVSSNFVKNRSYYINGKLLKEPNLENAISVVWNRFYILCVNSHCYLLDSTQKFAWETERTNLQYEAYYWENVPATAMCVYQDKLCFGTAQGEICLFKTTQEYGREAFSDEGEPIPCEWRTTFDADGAINFFKNMQKKGCVVVLQAVDPSQRYASAEVYIKADGEDEEYVGMIATDNIDIPSEFYLNKKVKKYKRLQIIVRNDMVNEAFGVREIIKVYTMGNYSKNNKKGSEIYNLAIDKNSNLYINGYNIDDMVRAEEDGVITLQNKILKLEYDIADGKLYYYEEE